MEKIGLYNQITAFTNEHAGTAEWCIAEKSGKNFFVKKFQSPVYADSKQTGLSQKKCMDRNKKFHAKVDAIKTLYQALRDNNTSRALVIPEEVINFQYHICTVADYIVGNVAPSQVCKLSEWQRIILMRTLTLALMNVHQAGIVHGDMKPDNILITQNAENGSCALKLIDFDASYMEKSPPKEVVGDLAYFAPEAYAMATSPEIRLNRKTDVFALGIIFHYFWTGRLPETTSKKPIGQCVLSGEEIRLDSSLPNVLRSAIEQALVADPEKRSSAKAIYDLLDKARAEYPVKMIILQERKPEPLRKPFVPHSLSETKPVTSVPKIASIVVLCRDVKGNSLTKRKEYISYGKSRVIYPAKIKGYHLYGDNRPITISIDSYGKQNRECVFTYEKTKIRKNAYWIAAIVFLYWCVTTIATNTAYSNGLWDTARVCAKISPFYSSIFREKNDEIVRIAESNSIALGPSGMSGSRLVEITSPGQTKMLLFVPKTTGYYVYSSSGKSDTIGFIYDDDRMTELVRNNDGGTGNNFLVRYRLISGHRYYLGVKYQMFSQKGKVMVTISKE